jgi:hypothetical protein
MEGNKFKPFRKVDQVISIVLAVACVLLFLVEVVK